MDERKSKINKVFIIVPVIAVVIIGIVFTCMCYYWHRNHKLLYRVDSITAYQHENNPDLYRIEIKGGVKTWFFDNKKYSSVELCGPSSGGEPKFWNAYAESETIDISKKWTKFVIKYDIDSTTSNGYFTFGDDNDYVDNNGVNYEYSGKDYIYSESFTPYSDNEIYELHYSLYMNDFRYIPVRWQESQVVTDSLLEQ